MSFRDRMRKTKSDSRLQKRHDGGKMKNDSKGKFPTVFLDKEIPEGITNWWCKEGQHNVDIIPFYAGPDFPLDGDNSPLVEEDEMTYKLELFVHRNVGPMNKPYVCPYENYGKPCPICEYIKSHDLEKEDWKSLTPKHRVFYFVWVHNSTEDEKKGIQIWEVAGFFMEEKLDEITALPKGGGYEHFWHPDTGKSIAWKRKGTKNTEYLGHRLVERDAKIPERILDQTFPMDSVINVHPSYKEIETDFRGTLKKLKLEGLPGDVDEDVNEDNDGLPDDYEDDMMDPKKVIRKKRYPSGENKTSSTKKKSAPAVKVRKRRRRK